MKGVEKTPLLTAFGEEDLRLEGGGFLSWIILCLVSAYSLAFDYK